MKKENILIICNGALESGTFLQSEAQKASLIVCADGGADAALKSGVTPDIVIGDLDSASSAAKDAFSASLWMHVTRQDNSDLEKALDYTLSKSASTLTIVCATGGRLDFSFGNILSAFNYLDRKDIVFKGEGWSIYPIDSTRTFKCTAGKRVSLIPVLGEVPGVTLSGLKYPLKNELLPVGSSALSNETLGHSFNVSFKEGRLLVYVED